MNKQTLYWSTNVKRLRMRRRLSQAQMAEILGISRPKLHAPESGRTKNPAADDLINFSTVFRISVDMLLKSDLRKVGELKLWEIEAAFSQGQA